MEIGNKIGFAFSSDEMSIIEIAELEGIKSKNIVGGLVSRLKGKVSLVGAEVKSTIPENLEVLLNKYQEDNKNSIVWVLIDDIDTKFQNTFEYQARVGSFFNAARSLAFDLNNRGQTTIFSYHYQVIVISPQIMRSMRSAESGR